MAALNDLRDGHLDDEIPHVASGTDARVTRPRQELRWGFGAPSSMRSSRTGTPPPDCVIRPLTR